MKFDGIGDVWGELPDVCQHAAAFAVGEAQHLLLHFAQGSSPTLRLLQHALKFLGI